MRLAFSAHSGVTKPAIGTGFGLLHLCCAQIATSPVIGPNAPKSALCFHEPWGMRKLTPSRRPSEEDRYDHVTEAVDATHQYALLKACLCHRYSPVCSWPPVIQVGT